MRWWRPKVLASGGVAASAAVVAIIVGGGGSSTANIWIDTTGGTCTDSASQVEYSDAAACTWDAANDTCEAGDTIRVKNGSYGNVLVNGYNARASDCTVYVEAGTQVGELDIGDWQRGTGDPLTLPDSAKVKYLKIIGPCDPRASSCTTPAKSTKFLADFTANVTLENWEVNAGGSAAGNTTQPFHVQFIDSAFIGRRLKIHNGWNSNALVYLGDGPITLEDADIYDSLNDTGGVIHEECIYANNVANFTLKRSRVWSCVAQTLFVTGSELATNWTIENSILESPLGPNDNALVFRSGGTPSPSPDGFTLRHSIVTSVSMTNTEHAPTSNGFVVKGNYFPTGIPCGLSNTTYAYNVVATGTTSCGGTGSTTFSSSSLNAGFVSPVSWSVRSETSPAAPGDWHLTATSPLLNIGNTSDYPALDIDGASRYVGAGPDIGPDER